MLGCKPQKAFTLVELLVVIAIMMTAVGLVGGLAVDSTQKYQAKAELLELERIIKKGAAHSYINESQMELLLEESEASLQVNKEGELVQISFQKFASLSFPRQTLSFSYLGIPSVNNVTVINRGKSAKLDVGQILNEVF